MLSFCPSYSDYPPSSVFLLSFFTDTATTEIYTLSLHDALPISFCHRKRRRRTHVGLRQPTQPQYQMFQRFRRRRPTPERDRKSTRLNSSHEWISYAVFCLKKKKN